MKKIFFILTAVLFLSLAPTAQGQNVAVSPCESLEYETEVVFTTSYGELKYDFSHNQKSLTEMGQGLGIVEKGLFASGLATIGVNWEVAVDTVSRIAGGDSVCVVPARLSVFLGYENPTIYISNELKADSCEYNVVIRHEQTHQQINKTALEYFIPRMKKAVEQMTKDIKPIEAQSLSDSERASASLTEEYARQIAPLVEFLKNELYEEHSKLDNHDNYKHEGEICSDFEN